MEKFYVFGFTAIECGNGDATTPNNIMNDILKTPLFVVREKGKTLIYFMDIIMAKGLPEYCPLFGKYMSLDFVRECALPFYKKYINKSPIKVIDENELPKDLGIVLKI